MTHPARHDESVLIIDDEENLRLTFELILERAGYVNVTGVSSFRAALELIERQRFDLVVSDIVLDGASGIDILRRIRERGLSCPVVLVTGFPNMETAMEAVRLGAFDYLSKPVKKDALLAVVTRAMERRRLEREKERIERERERTRSTSEAIWKSVREIIVTVDQQFTVAAMNDMALEWAGSALPGLRPGQPLADFAGNPIGQAFLNDVEEVRRTLAACAEHRIEWDLLAGGHGVLTASAAPLTDSQGAFLGVVLTARDLTHFDDAAGPGAAEPFHGMVGRSAAMQRVRHLIRNVGQVDTTVLVTGESGTGKELVAEALHAESPRRGGPLVKVDCTAIPETLLESELFGHRKGAFTGATADRPGRLLQADGGTIFLDEIGDISPRMQLRFLRFLQERTFYPVGGDQPVQVDVRVVTATNADLKERVRKDRFREDLYFRLRVVDIMLPPLREREGDIQLLASHFLALFNRKLGRAVSGFSDQALQCLTRYPWPGNVRELRHVVERAVVLCQGNTIVTEDLPPEIAVPAGSGAKGRETAPAHPYPEAPALLPAGEVERILQALRHAGGNKAKAARLLGVDRSTLYRKIEHLGIDLAGLEE